jgi:hypothetical protein
MARGDAAIDGDSDREMTGRAIESEDLHGCAILILPSPRAPSRACTPRM